VEMIPEKPGHPHPVVTKESAIKVLGVIFLIRVTQLIVETFSTVMAIN